MLMIFFFFSSRRRHTRWTGDWSSDVCSSDLEREWRGHGSGTFHGRHGRHVRVGGRAAPGAHHRGLLGNVVRAVPHGGTHSGPAGGTVSRQAEGGQGRRGREPEAGHALGRWVDSGYSAL